MGLLETEGCGGKMKMNGGVIQGAAEDCAASSPVLGVLSQSGNLQGPVALYFRTYNFRLIHRLFTCRQALAAGITD